jgi:hypothetical protein
LSPQEILIDAHHQDSCRKTILALHELKHPKKTVFIKQTNQALNQQINTPISFSNKTENLPEKSGNELLTEKTMDTARTRATSPENSVMETVAKRGC